jgi:hypothetical protein
MVITKEPALHGSYETLFWFNFIFIVIPDACRGWDKGHTYSTWAWIRLTWIRFHAAASRMPCLLAAGCAAAV